VPAAACTLIDQVPSAGPFMPQLAEAVMPPTGDASGSGELKPMLEGDTVKPLMLAVWADETLAQPTTASISRVQMRRAIKMPRS
jgi:hypothetical protein